MPYLLNAPSWIFLAVFFVIPLASVLALSVATGNPEVGYQYTGHVHEFVTAISTYQTQLIRSFWYGIASTVITLAISYPVAYWIAFYGGRNKSTYLFLMLLPFFVSFIIRTLAWEFILADQGMVLGHLKSWGLLPQSFHILSTGYAVVAGLAYNYLPFTALPLYVAIERIDKRVLDAAYDLYATRRQAFLRVILPLTIPGVFAAFLLTFIPALGDYVNQQILGGTGDTMIGTVIQNSFLTTLDYPAGSALSTVLMAIALIGIFAYARILGSRTIEEYL